MDMDVLENFQNDLHDLNAFNEFVDFGRITQNGNCMQHYKELYMQRIREGNRIRCQKHRRFNPLKDLVDTEFEYSYRFGKESMRRLLEMVKDDLEIDGGGEAAKRKNQVPVETQIMAAVRYWGGTEHPEITAQIHSITLHTLFKISKRVAEALSYKASRYIRMPCLLAEKEKVTKAFYDLARMPQVIGAVNHTVLKCKRVKREGTLPKPEERLHIQIVSDANLKIRDLDCQQLCGSNAQQTPADMFAESRIKERFEQNEFRGRILLGDWDLKCCSYLFTPVPGASTLAEQAFNSSLHLAYEPARRCLQLWKQRFGILNEEFVGQANAGRHVVVALALLHNMALDWEDKAMERLNLMPAGDATPRTGKNSDERSRNEFIKNHFQTYN